MSRYIEPNSVNSNAEQKRPKPVSDGIIPRAPKWLTVNAKKIYRETANEIVNLGVGGKCDGNILAMFSAQMDRLQTISQQKERDSRLERLQNDITASTLQLAKELGVTPSARAKMRIAKIEEENPLDSMFQEETKNE